MGPTGSRARLEQAIADLVLDAPENRLADFGGQPIYGRPLIGVASGDDPLFLRYRGVVAPSHLLPRELLERRAPAGAELSHVSVVVWVLPFTAAVRRSNRGQRWPSRLYSAARNNGGALNYALRAHVAELLRRRGHVAVAPVLDERYEAFRCPSRTYSSSWSERHAAFAAGLGLFGLSGALITPVGSHVRLGSVVTNLPLEPTPSAGDHHRAPCLRSGGAVCGQCMGRCPADAISARGLDKARCEAMRKAVRERFLDAYASELHLLRAPIAKRGSRTNGFSLGCALCQCGVPCEGGAPHHTI